MVNDAASSGTGCSGPHLELGDGDLEPRAILSPGRRQAEAVAAHVVVLAAAAAGGEHHLARHLRRLPVMGGLCDRRTWPHTRDMFS